MPAYSTIADRGTQVPHSKGVPVYMHTKYRVASLKETATLEVSGSEMQALLD